MTHLAPVRLDRAATGRTDMRVAFVDLKAQYLEIKDEIDDAIARVIADTAFVGGKHLAAFEEAYASYIGARHCLGVGNGTDAIEMALRALEIGEGDEVITAANTFIATSEAISATGAQVVFVDPDPESYTIDPARIEAAITERTRAIVPVHLYGQPADLEPILALASRRGLHVVEDAAQAHGALYRGRKVGTFGICACYSFYPGKNLGAYGDGGAVVTDDEQIARRVRMLRDHGSERKYVHEREGRNSRLDGIQAAVLQVKLRHLEEWTERRIAAAGRYAERLRGMGGEIVTPAVQAGRRHVFHLYVVRLDDREAVQKRLADSGIATGIHYPIALPFQPAYSYLGARPADYPVAHGQMGQLLSLPMHGNLPLEQVDLVCDTLEAALRG
jgi:dTDP-4-amino-4,6-dideoxygalactose transaminase